MDKPPDAATTKLEQAEKGLYPYAYLVSPLDVLDVVFNDKTGEIEQILIHETTRGEIDLRKERESDGLQDRWRLWVKDKTGVVTWTLYKKDKDNKPVEEANGTITLNRIPIEKVTRGNSTYGGNSVIGAIATLDRSIYNYNSCCDQIIYDQTFSTLVLEFDGTMQVFFDEWGVVLGTKSIVPYPKGSEPPQFISPDASQGEFILKRIDQKTNQIYQVQNLQDTMGNAQKGQAEKAQSGVAKGWDFEKLNAGLCEYGDVLEKAERAMLKLVQLWEEDKKELDPDIVSYPESFDVKSLTDQLAEYNLLSTAVTSETYRKILEKDLVKKATPKLEKQDMDAVMSEIDASQNLELEAQKQALKMGNTKPNG